MTTTNRQGRIPGILTKPVDLLVDEHVIRSGYAVYSSIRISPYMSRIYLTKLRPIFAPHRLAAFAFGPPLGGQPLTIRHEDVESVGEAIARSHIIFWIRNWYLRTHDKTYYFATLRTEGLKWPSLIAVKAGVTLR